jgi:hypothetical protein
MAEPEIQRTSNWLQDFTAGTVDKSPRMLEIIASAPAEVVAFVRETGLLCGMILGLEHPREATNLVASMDKTAIGFAKGMAESILEYLKLREEEE